MLPSMLTTAAEMISALPAVIVEGVPAAVEFDVTPLMTWFCRSMTWKYWPHPEQLNGPESPFQYACPLYQLFSQPAVRPPVAPALIPPVVATGRNTFE